MAGADTKLYAGRSNPTGANLIERGIIHHVLDEYPFRDDYFFYSFYVDEESVAVDSHS
jgi:hypothetical protein